MKSHRYIHITNTRFWTELYRGVIHSNTDNLYPVVYRSRHLSLDYFSHYKKVPFF